MTSRGEPSWFWRNGALQRLAAALATGCATWLVQPQWIAAPTRALLAWDLAALTYLGLAWVIIWRADAGTTREHALSQDQSAYLIFLFVLSAAGAGIVAIGFMVGGLKSLAFWPRAWHLALAVLALLSAWLLIHTVFAFHYARRYHAARRPAHSQPAELVFPGGHAPDYLDFCYFSFVVGMTSQVSDVAVSSRRMRRLTLTHSVLAFVFNIAILALSLNIIASAI